MAKKQSIAPVAQHKCSRCGQLLPVNDRGVPVTSLWDRGRWLCPDCKFKGEEMQNDKV